MDLPPGAPVAMAHPEKQHRLRQYQLKDYSSLVEFPVEIVGRDGVIRAFTFEDAVRLYQRRILSAHERFGDTEVVQAEVFHCRRRIRQLRRSYLLHHAWASIRSLGSRDDLGGEMAAEVAAFLRRFTARRGEDPEAYRFAAIQREGPARIYWLTRDEGRPRLLYVYRFEGTQGGVAREAFERFVVALHHARPLAEATERLLAAWQAVDCGILLTTRADAGEDPDGSEASQIPSLDPDRVGDPFASALKDLREGDAEPALEALAALLERHPDHRDAALAASLAADLLGRREEAELYARLACRHHPRDAALEHQLAVVLVHQGRLVEAQASLEAALGLDPRLFGARFLLILLELHRGHTTRARQHLGEAETGADPEQRELLAALDQLLRRIVRRRRHLALAGLATLAALIAGLAGWTPGWVLAVAVAVLAWGLLRNAPSSDPAPPSLLLPDEPGPRLGFRSRADTRNIQ
ncbi:MAG: hypothetical protein JXB39_14165 [Deltaproteobacteria bacterium]|nr:hypothetical protein [Deltaproteobacteria bacterium]